MNDHWVHDNNIAEFGEQVVKQIIYWKKYASKYGSWTDPNRQLNSSFMGLKDNCLECKIMLLVWHITMQDIIAGNRNE
jgi:hypothetical protein